MYDANRKYKPGDIVFEAGGAMAVCVKTVKGIAPYTEGAASSITEHWARP
jgi:hypothetical protein